MHGLMQLLQDQYSRDQIVELLGCSESSAQKVALLAVGLVGGKCCIEEVSRHLKNVDPVVNQLAEHALWSIWLRCGKSCEANRAIAQGTHALDRRDFALAITHFDQAISLDPDFAEAYNQRAIARFLMDEYALSACDCRKTVRRMPCHFGAWAGMGHCETHLGRLDEAVNCYAKALEINPHLQGIRQALHELQRRRKV